MFDECKIKLYFCNTGVFTYAVANEPLTRFMKGFAYVKVLSEKQNQ